MKEFFVAGNIIASLENDVINCLDVVNVGEREESVFLG